MNEAHVVVSPRHQRSSSRITRTPRVWPSRHTLSSKRRASASPTIRAFFMLVPLLGSAQWIACRTAVRSVDVVLTLELPDVMSDRVDVISARIGLGRHVAKPPVVRANAPANG